MPIIKRKYVINNQEVMKRWNYVKNDELGLNPNEITEGSHIKANFTCPFCESEWYGEIRYVIRYNGGCPTCAQKKRQESFYKTQIGNLQKLFETNPELEEEWDYEKNQEIGLNPNKLVAGSNKEAYWICSLGHKYKAYISNRALKHTGCTFCSGQQVLKGYNDLATTRPDLLLEWDYELNSKKGIFPDNVMRGSHQLVHWICPFGHKYTKEIHARDGGKGCTVCSKESQTSFPEQALYFYIVKVFPDTLNRYGRPEIDIYIPSLKLGIEYDGAYAHKNKQVSEEKKNKIIKDRGIDLIRIKEVTKLKKDSKDIIYCKANSNNTFLNEVIIKLEKVINKTYKLYIRFNPDIIKDRIKIEEQYISLRKENSIANKYPEIAKEWDYEKNCQIKPEYITCGTHRKYFWICENGHSYQCSPRDRINGRGCEICSGFNYIKGVNDFQTKYPKLAEFWDYSLNNIGPSDIKYTNGKMYWWKCNKGHSYQTQIKTMIKYNNCLGCVKKVHILVRGVNDFATLNPELAKEWDFEKNKLSPNDFAVNSNKKVFWICGKCGYRWLDIINNRKNCPNCVKNSKIINVYDIETMNLLYSFENINELCKTLKIDKGKQRGNITSVCKRNQKTLSYKYILRYNSDDEFKEMNLQARKKE